MERDYRYTVMERLEARNSINHGADVAQWWSLPLISGRLLVQVQSSVPFLQSLSSMEECAVYTRRTSDRYRQGLPCSYNLTGRISDLYPEGARSTRAGSLFAGVPSMIQGDTRNVVFAGLTPAVSSNASVPQLVQDGLGMSAFTRANRVIGSTCRLRLVGEHCPFKAA